MIIHKAHWMKIKVSKMSIPVTVATMMPTFLKPMKTTRTYMAA